MNFSICIIHFVAQVRRYGTQTVTGFSSGLSLCLALGLLTALLTAAPGLRNGRASAIPNPLSAPHGPSSSWPLSSLSVHLRAKHV